MIKAVIFDIDDTLYSFKERHEKAFQALQQYVGDHFGWDAEDFKNQHAAMMKVLMEKLGPIAAGHNRLIRFQNMLAKKNLPVHHALTMCNLYWDTLIDGAQPFDGLREAMQTVKAKGIRLYIGSNMTALMQFRKLDKLGVLPLIDYVITSEEAGIDKPYKAFFDYCLLRAGCKKEECLFIGDSLEHDIRGAMEAGLPALRYYPQASEEEDKLPYKYIRSWHDLPDAIQCSL